ncbi:hypothetical protein K6V25_14105 [Bacteroides salyersiae]|uniref:hypothetical protein n=1 Tax=Bacteroides salyersiae TaxID=291644 RepID=UPI001CCC95B3|nr:hypothetical protein [Bacteroides salyersiae]UBD64070.1 hypothetical protein K6V25_14105 [Bacteroides salyersiae]
MGDNTIEIIDFESIGRVLDGVSSEYDRNHLLLHLNDLSYMGCFLVALKAMDKFMNNQLTNYETVQ